MPAMPIEWHQRNLTNMEKTLARVEKEAADAQERATSIRRSVDYAQGQIDRATREGKDKYDADRYIPSPNNHT